MKVLLLLSCDISSDDVSAHSYSDLFPAHFLFYKLRDNAKPDLRLPSRPQSTAPWPVLTSRSVEGMRLNWPEVVTVE